MAKATGVPTAAHELDADPFPVKPDRILANGDTVKIGELSFDVIHLQGHTPGSVALALDGADDATHLFTGDCLFPGGVGKTWKEGDFEQLLDDVSSRVFDVYGDSTVVYPGHGDDTTLGTERPHLMSGKNAVGSGSRQAGCRRHGREPRRRARYRACARQSRVHRLRHRAYGEEPASRRSRARSTKPPSWSPPRAAQELPSMSTIPMTSRRKRSSTGSEREQGRLDILVNNAAIIRDEMMGRTRFWEEPINVIDTLDVGLRSGYVATVYAAPLMLPQSHGLVVFTSAPGAAHYVFGPSYGVHKAGMDKMAADMAVDFKEFGIAAVSIWMGVLFTERLKNIVAGNPGEIRPAC